MERLRPTGVIRRGCGVPDGGVKLTGLCARTNPRLANSGQHWRILIKRFGLTPDFHSYSCFKVGTDVELSGESKGALE